jgi:nucleoside-diphosphate-sugar epimerase
MRRPYIHNPVWGCVERLTLDRADPAFCRRIAELGADFLIDLTCYTLEEARDLVSALRLSRTRLLHCGTIWVHGVSIEVPTTENRPRKPISDYGARKAEIERFLLSQSEVPVSILHPGHLVGEGWIPLNPAANFNPGVFDDLAGGREIALPNLGRETLHHVHADDVAHCFVKALQNWPRAEGRCFHVVSSAAVTLVGYAETVAQWYGREARIRFLPWDEWRRSVADREAAVTWDHIARSPNCSIALAREQLGYSPRYTSFEAVRESLFSPLYPRRADC